MELLALLPAPLLLILGVPLLVKGADGFVDGAATLAHRFGVPATVVGALVLGFGTSAPEAVVSVRAATSGSLDLALGNALGSNVANLTLVIGATALICAVPSSRRTRRVLWPAATGAMVLLGVLLVDGALTRADGLVLLAGMAVALVVLMRGAAGDDPADDDPADPTEHRATTRLVGITVLGGAGVLAGAELIVAGATTIATSIGLSEGFVGLTIVALGTSLPELATGVSAARRGQTQLLLGNVLGSNVFNTLAVVGMAAVAGPARLVDPALALTSAGIALGATLLAGMALRAEHIGRRAGGVALVAWAAMLPVLA